MLAARATVGLAALFASTAIAVAAPGPDVRVRASAFIDAQVQPRGDETEARGVVLDDLGHPVAQAGLLLELERAVESAGDDAMPVPCPPTTAVAVAESRPPPRSNSYRIETSTTGQFCVRLSDKHARGKLRLSLDPRGLNEAP